MVRVVAFDNDCVISKYDMLDVVSHKIGKSEDGKYWEDEYEYCADQEPWPPLVEIEGGNVQIREK